MYCKITISETIRHTLSHLLTHARPKTWKTTLNEKWRNRKLQKQEKTVHHWQCTHALPVFESMVFRNCTMVILLLSLLLHFIDRRWADNCDKFFLYFILQRCQPLDYMASNGRIVDEWCNGKDLGGSDCCLIEVQSRHLPEGNSECHENPSQDSRYIIGQDPTRKPSEAPEYESKALPLRQPSRSD
jgi:hypothetical protein